MALVDLIFPKKCLECGRNDKYICNSCIRKVGFSKLICCECDKASVDGFTHIKCKKALSFDGTFSIWKYDGVVRKSIIKLKYNFAFEIADELADIGGRFLISKFNALPKNSILVPVPLHSKRKNWRGFNQADNMGEIIADKVGWKYARNLLVRKRMNTPQVELSGSQRRNNMLGIFDFNKDYLSVLEKAKNYSLIVFDDVWTTGSTLKEAAKVLKRKGFSNVWGLTIAR